MGTLKLGKGCYIGFSEPDQHVQQIFGTASLVLDAVIGYLSLGRQLADEVSWQAASPDRCQASAGGVADSGRVMGRRQDADLDLALLLPSFVPLGTLMFGKIFIVDLWNP